MTTEFSADDKSIYAVLSNYFPFSVDPKTKESQYVSIATLKPKGLSELITLLLYKFSNVLARDILLTTFGNQLINKDKVTDKFDITAKILMCIRDEFKTNLEEIDTELSIAEQFKYLNRMKIAKDLFASISSYLPKKETNEDLDDESEEDEAEERQYYIKMLSDAYDELYDMDQVTKQDVMKWKNMIVGNAERKSLIDVPFKFGMFEKMDPNISIDTLKQIYDEIEDRIEEKQNEYEVLKSELKEKYKYDPNNIDFYLDNLSDGIGDLSQMYDDGDDEEIFFTYNDMINILKKLLESKKSLYKFFSDMIKNKEGYYLSSDEYEDGPKEYIKYKEDYKYKTDDYSKIGSIIKKIKNNKGSYVKIGGDTYSYEYYMATIYMEMINVVKKSNITGNVYFISGNTAYIIYERMED